MAAMTAEKLQKNGSFCGTDGKYHFYNCYDYFTYGPETDTGIVKDNDTPPRLLCKPDSTNVGFVDDDDDDGYV